MVIYKCSMAGPFHIESGLPCQDSFAIFQGGSFSVLAVADGLGSELYSDVGAAVAADTAVKYCSERINEGMEFAEIKKVMNNAFVSAYKAVLTRAAEDGNDSDEYDTTLCLAVYDGEHLYFAQAGDSGLVALLENGEYYRVTTQQRDAEGRVFPLCWGPDRWDFGCVDAPVSAFMLMTDGVFEQICPKLLRKRPIEINIPLARRFLDRFDCTEEDVPELEKAVREYLEHFRRDLLDDDKTVVVLINPMRRPEEKDEAYYAIPDWKALRGEAEKRLSGMHLEEAETDAEPALIIEESAPDDLTASADPPHRDPNDAQLGQFDGAGTNKTLSAAAGPVTKRSDSDGAEANKALSADAGSASERSDDVKKNEQPDELQSRLTSS